MFLGFTLRIRLKIKNLKRMTKPVHLLILFFAVATASFSQSVRNVEVRVNADQILVGYTISGLKDYQDISKITFYVSRDGGKTFEGPLKEISGDIDSDVRNGKYIMV